MLTILMIIVRISHLQIPYVVKTVPVSVYFYFHASLHPDLQNEHTHLGLVISKGILSCHIHSS